MNKIIKIFKNPMWFFGAVLRRLSFLIKNDQTYIKWEFFFAMHKFPNLENPKTFNEKLQWLKLHNKHEYFTALVDKHTAKEYVKGIIGEDYIIPTIGIWEKFEDINFSELPNKFVLKCTHDSGGLIICKDKFNLDIDKAKKKISKCLKKNYYKEHREYPYKNVKPQIIAETFLDHGKSESLNDYKFMCFNGICKLIFVCSNRSKSNVNVDFFDTEWNHYSFKRHYEHSKAPIPRPHNLQKMITIAETIAKTIDTPFVRIDLYDVLNKIYFGEITFFPGAGLEEFQPEEWDYKIGQWIKLPDKQ